MDSHFCKRITCVSWNIEMRAMCENETERGTILNVCEKILILNQAMGLHHKAFVSFVCYFVYQFYAQLCKQFAHCLIYIFVARTYSKVYALLGGHTQFWLKWSSITPSYAQLDDFAWNHQKSIKKDFSFWRSLIGDENYSQMTWSRNSLHIRKKSFSAKTLCFVVTHTVVKFANWAKISLVKFMTVFQCL